MDGLFSLVEHGMTAKEIFGDELAARLLNQNTPSDSLEKAKWVKQGLLDLLSQIGEEPPKG